jgi:hypothetical protein
LNLGPTLFSIYINNIAKAVGTALIHLYADDTVLYSASPSLDVVLNALQQSFLRVQQAFSTLNFVLNNSKTKVMWFGKKNAPHPTCVINTSEGLGLEIVISYKYLGVWIYGTLSFSQHMSWLQAKVKSRLGFLYSNRSSFTPAAKLTLIQMTILPMLDYGVIIDRSAGKGALEWIDVLYQSAISFATNAPYRTHHCTLYSSLNWSSLYTLG